MPARLFELAAKIEARDPASANEAYVFNQAERQWIATALRQVAVEKSDAAREALIEHFADRCFDRAGEGASYPSVLQAMRDLLNAVLPKQEAG